MIIECFCMKIDDYICHALIIGYDEVGYLINAYKGE